MKRAVALRRVALHGHDFFYFEEGAASGTTVILLHGFPDTPHSFAAVAAELSRCGHRVLRPYLPGYFPCTWPGPFDLRSVVSRLSAFVRATSARPVYLVGHDWGAILSYALLHSEPKLIAKAATLSVPHLRQLIRNGASHPGQILRSAYIMRLQLPLIAERWAQRDLVSTLWTRWSPGLENQHEAIAQAERCVRSSGSRPFQYYRQLGRSLTKGPRGFGDIAVPLLYLHGARDGCVLPDMALGQERYCKGGYASHVLQDAGHFLQVEQSEQVARHLVGWFS